MNQQINLGDKEIRCKECGKTFVFSVGGQEFFAKMKFADPVRCKTCRDKRNMSGGKKR